ncbi:Acyl-CoA wax alcohol acyltransferase 2 [Manis javanica]|nr:Acyl-CoA wax alcohol acyltransferase 2 [Manis javanica]
MVRKPLPLPKIENPSPDSVAKYLAFYINALCKLFNQHETKSGISETQELVSLTDIPTACQPERASAAALAAKRTGIAIKG